MGYVSMDVDFDSFFKFKIIIRIISKIVMNRWYGCRVGNVDVMVLVLVEMFIVIVRI